MNFNVNTNSKKTQKSDKLKKLNWVGLIINGALLQTPRDTQTVKQ